MALKTHSNHALHNRTAYESPRHIPPAMVEPPLTYTVDTGNVDKLSKH